MILRGKRLTKRDLVDGGKYPVFHGGKEPIGYYHEKNRDANTTMIINTGDCGCVSWSDKDFWSSDGCFCVKTPQDILNKFIYYVLSNKEYEIKSKTRTAGIPTLDKKDVENITISIPSITRQQEIVEILDKFDTLVNDISKGLPREIELRRKHYEYYRERLVSFG